MFLAANILSRVQITMSNEYQELNFLSYVQLSRSLVSWNLIFGSFQKLLAHDNESEASD